MSDNLSSMNIDLVSDFLATSGQCRVGLNGEQAALASLYASVAARCGGFLDGLDAIAGGGAAVLDIWAHNDVGARAIRNAVSPFGGGQVTVSSSVIGDALMDSGSGAAPDAYDDGPGELVGFPPNSGFVDDPVCAANGNFVHGDRDFTTHGFGQLIDTVRMYNSLHQGLLTTTRGVFGHGWSSMLDMEVRDPDERGVVRVVLADGAIAPFIPDGKDGFVLDGRRRLELTASEHGWTLRHGHDQTWLFDLEGRLSGGRERLASFTVRRSLHRITLTETRSSRTMTYSLNDDGLVVKARAGDGRTVSYEYEDEHCVAARRPIGDVTYEIADDLIAAIHDADGVLFCRNTYNEAGQVLTQLSAHGRTTVYRYDTHGRAGNELGIGGVTVVGDTDNGPEATFAHDARGNLIAMSGDSGVEATMRWDHFDRLTHHVDRDGQETRYRYHPDPSLDLLVERIDPDGLTEERSYDDSGRLIREVGRAGEVHEYTYDGDRRTPGLIVGPTGGRVTTTFGDNDLPSTITDADGVVSTFLWDDDGRMVATVNGAGDRTVFVYDKAGRLVRVTDPMGKSAAFHRERSGRVAEVTNVEGVVHAYVNSDAGRVLECATGGPGSWTATYGSHGQVETFADALGATVRYGYDVYGNIVAVTAPDGDTYHQEYDSEANLVAAVDAAGNRSTQEFDAAGRSIRVVNGEDEAWNRTVDELGRTATLTAPDGLATIWEYHPNGEVAAYTSPLGETYRYEVDGLGQLTAEIDPSGRRTTYEYTPGGRMLRRTSAVGRTYDYAYDNAGRLSAITDDDGVDVTAQFRPDGSVAELSSGESTTRFDYDLEGRVTSWTNDQGDAGPSTEWEPNRASVAVADTSAAVFDWDPRGLLASATDAAGITTEFERDLRGRITGVATEGSQTAVTFDPTGAMGTFTDALGTTTTMSNSATGIPLAVQVGDATGPEAIGWSYAYDEMRRVTSIHSPTGDELVSYDYDALGHRTGASNAHGTVAITRDRHGRLDAIESLDGSTRRFTRDDDGYLSRAERSDGTSTDYLRSPAGRLLAFGDSDAGVVPLPFLDPASELRSAAGRIIGDHHGRVYNYDSAGRLVESITHDGERSAFTYDDFGFLATDTTPAHGRRQFRYNVGGELEQVVAEDGTTSEFSYDAAGRRTAELHADGTRVRYSWNDLNHLTQITRTAPDGETTTREVTYSGLDRPERIDDTVIGWDDAITGKPVQIGEDRYLRSGGLVRRAVPDAPWIDGTTDDPWGDTGHNSSGIGLGYRGELTVDNLVFMGARVYDPATRTFLSRDPLPSVAGATGYSGGYTYAWNDPVNYLDPTGHRPISRDEFDDWKAAQERSRWGNMVHAIKEDPWGTVAMVAVAAVGVALIATGVGAGIGAGILIGVAVSGGIGFATNNFNPRTVAISGAFGAIPGAGGSAAMAVGGAFVAGAAEDVVNQVVAEGVGLGDINLTSVVISGATAGVGTGAAGVVTNHLPSFGNMLPGGKPSGPTNHGTRPPTSGNTNVDDTLLDVSGAAAAPSVTPQQFAPAPKVHPAPNAPVKPGDIGTYGELKTHKRKFGETEPMDMDHQPSFAAQQRALENQLGRPLTPAEKRALKNATPAVAAPRPIHQQSSPTYGGRNTPEQIAADAEDLAAAAARDEAAFDEAMKGRHE